MSGDSWSSDGELPSIEETRSVLIKRIHDELSAHTYNHVYLNIANFSETKPKPETNAEKTVYWFLYGRKYEDKKCEHDLEVKDDSFDHEFGIEQIHYLECMHCGATHEEDSSIPESVEDWFSDSEFDIGN